MIPLTEINDAVGKFKVPAETIEKDYVISWILYCLSKSELQEDFIFYGGTAIKRIYFEDHRFSEDIDLFSTKSFSTQYILLILKTYIEKYGFKPSLNIILSRLTNTSLKTNWNLRLAKQISNLPHIEQVIQETTFHLENLFGSNPK